MENKTDRDEQRMQANRDELIERIAKATHKEGVIEPLKGIHLGRRSEPNKKLHSVLVPSFCVIAQGKKVVFLGDTQYQYDPLNYFIATIELPNATQVVEASKEQPYLSFRLELDPNIVGSVLVEAGHVISSNLADTRAIAVSALEVDLLDAVVRLVRLLDTPDKVRILVPLIIREIIYHLLMGDQGSRLRYMTIHGGYTPHIARAIERLRNFDQPVRIEELAQELGMSVSSFHQHFKSVTAMSPLQFQKRLRLQEARRLMLGGDLDATTAAYHVGYNDAAHFNREYKSLFGEPPMRDVQRLREESLEITE